MVTPTGSLLAARPIVAICERSPHSARNVMTNVSTSTGESKAPFFFFFVDFFFLSASASSASVSASSSPPPSHAKIDSYSERRPKKKKRPTAR